MSSTIQIRVDDELKMKSDQLFKDLGTDTTTAIRMFLTQAVANLSLCENQRLRALGYHRINFLRHRYFMLYRIEENTVFIDDIFHELQDYENKMK